MLIEQSELCIISSYVSEFRTHNQNKIPITIDNVWRTYESCNQTTSDNSNVIVDGHLVYAQLGYNMAL